MYRVCLDCACVYRLCLTSCIIYINRHFGIKGRDNKDGKILKTFATMGWGVYVL